MKHHVRSAGAALALCAFQTFAAGDAALAPWFDRLPAMPKTVAEAQARIHYANGRATLDAPAHDSYAQQLRARRQTLEQQAAAAAQKGEAAVGGMQQDLNAAAGEDISSPEFQKKLERMTDAEKMAFAMKMNGQMQKSMGTSYAGGASLGAPESAAVQAAQTASMQYQQQFALQLQNGAATMRLVPALEQAHRELDERLSREAASCVTAADPAQVQACLKTKSGACWDQHAALAAQQLTSLQSAYQQQLARARKDAAEADRVLAPTQYGAQARSYNGQSQLLGYQQQILASAESLLQLSEAAWLDVGAWGAGKTQSAGQPLAVVGSEASCGYETRFGRDGSSGGRSGSSRPGPAGKATRSVQDGARKVLNWLGH
ncbi:hypothetical protein [Solimonas soli]|uniref:hypothetical protein n=1 Tax=Solimonas soli TaxID=413479 RepID=UPI000481E039|nr:hypothetical protein [Solimonas soli]